MTVISRLASSTPTALWRIIPALPRYRSLAAIADTRQPIDKSRCGRRTPRTSGILSIKHL